MPPLACHMLIRFVTAACLLLPAAAALAQADKTTVLKTESTLEMDFGQHNKQGPFGVSEIKSMERRLIAVPGIEGPSGYGTRRATLVLETEVSRRENLDEKGVDGTVKITAWQYGPEAARKKLYSLETSGMEMKAEYPFLITQEFADMGSGPWLRYFFMHTGEFAFENFSPAAQAYFTETAAAPKGRVARYAGFDAGMNGKTWPKVDGGVIGLLTYTDGQHILDRVLLVHRDRDAAESLSNVVDESHRLDFVDQDRRADSQGNPMTTPFGGQKLRLRFRGSNLDLYFPVKEGGFVADDPLQGLPPGFSLVPYAPPKR